MRARQRRAVNLGFERLESRVTLAGNVVASVVGGSLILRGDSLDNWMRIESGPEPGDFVITGRDSVEGNPLQFLPTTINRQRRLTVHGVTRNMQIHLGDGNDDLDIENRAPLAGGNAPIVNIADNLTVYGNLGTDSVVFHDVHVGGNLNVDLGVGRSEEVQQMLLGRTQVGGRVTVRAPGGDANVVMHDGSAGGSVTFFGGIGHDRVTATSFDVRGDLTIHGGTDSDMVEVIDSKIGRDLRIFINEPTDEVDDSGESLTLSGLLIGSDLYVRTSSADEVITVFDTQVGDMATILSGMGNDTVNLGVNPSGQIVDGLHAKRLVVQSGPGDDTVQMARTTIAKDLIFALGSGRDVVNFKGANDVSGWSWLHGSGADELHFEGDNRLGKLRAFGFARHA